MDKFRIDSHKLIYHIPRLYKWVQGENIYPIYIEISLYGGCNHRCVFCAFDFLKYKPAALNEKYLKKFILEASQKGVKAVLFSGEGEPLLNKNAKDIFIFTKKAGIDVALVTNGVRFNKKTAEESLGYLSWLKVSLDAGSDKTYSIIRKAAKNDFYKVLRNLKDAVKLKNKNKLQCTIGAQYLLIPQNYKEITNAIMILRDIGIDYLVIKPYSQHPLSKSRVDDRFKYSSLLHLAKSLEEYSKDDFHVIFRFRAVKKLEEEKPYKKCLGLPFAAHITAEGDIYPCNVFIGKKEFVFGNIYKEGFEDIWDGQRRKRVMDTIYNKIAIGGCRKACRLDEINRYLWELKNPNSHVNFI